MLSYHLYNFNSIKVRLKLRSPPLRLPRWTYFNSIKVRLKRYICRRNRTGHRQFQFHKGTIKTLSSVSSSRQFSNFNSIKVRLKPLLLQRDKPSTLFQFHKGTIKTPCSVAALKRFHPNFNSIKVRLKHQYFGTNKTFVFEFQFHKGTIKTLPKYHHTI